MRTDEIVVTAKQLDVVVKTGLLATVCKRTTRAICRALPDRQIQTLDEGCIECRRVFGGRQRLGKLLGSANCLPSFHGGDAIVPSRLEHLVEEAHGPEDLSGNTWVIIESGASDKNCPTPKHLVAHRAKNRARVLVAASPDQGRRPEPRPDIDGREDPGRLILSAGECTNLIDLKLPDIEVTRVYLVEATAAGCCFLKPAIHRVPRQSHYAGYG